MEQARKGAESFFARFGHGDELTLMPFDEPGVTRRSGRSPPTPVSGQLDQKTRRPSQAGGGTSLYDAVDAAYALAR